MRTILLAIVFVIATGLVACGDNEKAPLTLSQRSLQETDAPGSKPDPVEVELTAADLEEFKGLQANEYVRAANIDRKKLEQAGFVSAIHTTRFFPKTPGGAHTRDTGHVRITVLQFESEDGAAKGADLVYANSVKPCPGQCIVQNVEFDVSGVPDATGLHQYVTAARIKNAGDPATDEPFDAYVIGFADGPFAYEVEGFGPPGKMTKKHAEEIAQRVYDRVKGAPPAGT